MSGRQEINCIIRNSTVIDGTGAPRFGADIAIAGDRITAVRGSSLRAKGAREMDARGMIVAPGFIDVHAHDDLALLSMPDMTPKISQGVTTVVAGNCGISLAPLAMPGVPPPPLDLLSSEPGCFRFERFRAFVDALRDSPPAVNYGLLVGHITLRHRVMDQFDRAATAAEVAEMRRQVQAAMNEGAIGFSTGLDYPSAVAAPTGEILPLVEAVKPHGGLYCSHHRNYFEKLEEAIDEALMIYLRARARLSRKTAQSGRARHPPVLLRHCLWGTRPAAPRTPATRCRVVCLAVKPVGEPDSGNRDLRFDERRWETG